METIAIHICRTCLGPLNEAPKNLLNPIFSDVLEVLRGFIPNMIEGVIDICALCYEKLDYIHKFKLQCQKAFQEYVEIKNKKDPIISNLGQIFEDDYLSAKIDLDSENLEDTITIYKNSEETETNSEVAMESEIVEPKIIEPTTSNPRRGSRAKQFPTQDVLAAIEDGSSYQTALKNRKCIHCDYVTKINRQLCVHMKYKHVEELKTWCNRCNIQTNDLEEHMKVVQCCEFICKFCNKKCRRLFMLMAHLKCHAFEHFAVQAKKSKALSQDATDDKAVVFPQQYYQQEKSLQQLSNVVFQFDNNVTVSTVTTNLEPQAVLTIPTTNPPINTITTDGRIKVNRISKQYDSALVLQALAESSNHLRDVKNRTCMHCKVVSSVASGLNNHMLRAHSEFYRFWCNRCNVQTEDLQAHKDLVKCNTFACKFCEKEFNKLNKLTKHLQCHCHEIFRNKATVEEEPTVQLQALTSASNDLQQSSDSMPILENTDGNITYENSQEFFFPEVNNDVNMSYENSQQTNHEINPENATVKIEEDFENTDGTMTYESTHSTYESTENTDGNITYQSLENADGKLVYGSLASMAGKLTFEIKQEPQDALIENEMLSEFTESNSMDEIKQEIKMEDDSMLCPSESYDNSSASEDESDNGADADNSGDGPGWALLEQVDPDRVVKALTSVRKPVLVHSRCNLCQSAMSDNRGLSLHMTVVHKQEKEKWCRTCNDLYDDIVGHKEIHAPKCEFCNKTFNFLSHLRSHLKNHARNHNFKTSTWSTCKACSNSFPDEEQLNKHECTPDPSKVDYKKCRTYCSLCNEAVPVLRDHMKEKHNTDGASDTNLCSVCGKSFTSTYQLNIHMRKHTGDLPYKCLDCNKCFAAKHLLTIHEKVHTEGKNNICHICNKPFSTSAQLESHMTLQHAGNPLQCDQCDKTFSTKAQLTVHARQHGERNHLCSECNRAFSNKAALSSHVRHNHTEDRPFKCGYCESTFKVRSSMKSHEYIHTGIKPFKCTECSYSCRQGYRLSAHMKQHAEQIKNKNTHVCVFCQERFPTHLQLISHTYSAHGEMPMEGVAADNAPLNLTPTITTTPNVVNITSHHIILQDGNSSQTIQISGLNMNTAQNISRIHEGEALTQLVQMESTGTNQLEVGTNNIEANVVAMDDMDNVPIQIVYKPLGLG